MLRIKEKLFQILPPNAKIFALKNIATAQHTVAYKHKKTGRENAPRINKNSA